MASDRLSKEVIQRSLEFHQRRFWLKFDREAVIAVEIPGFDEPLIASIVGHEGKRFGLDIYRGSEALSHIRRIMMGETHSLIIDRTSIQSIDVDRFGNIPKKQKACIHDKAGFSVRKEALAPFFGCKDAGKQIRLPNRSQLKQLLYVTNAILVADEQGILHPASCFSKRIFTLKVEGSAFKPTIAGRLAKVKEFMSGFDRSDDLVSMKLKAMPHNHETWIAGFVSLPGVVEDDERSLSVFAIFDAEAESLVHMTPILGGSIEDSSSFLFQCMLGVADTEVKVDCRPETIILADKELHDRIAGTLKNSAVELRFEPNTEIMDKLRDTLLERFKPEASDSWGVDPISDTPRSLGEWRAVSISVSEKIGTEFLARRRMNENLENRFFGQSIRSFQDNNEKSVTAMSYTMLEWSAVYDRPTKNSKTIAELLLGSKKLSDAQRTVLGAHFDLAPSIFRVESVDPGESIELMNVFNSQRFNVFDQSLSRSIPLGCAIIAQLIPVESWHFGMFFCSPISLGQVDPLIRFLKKEGVEFDTDGVAKGAEKLGRALPWIVKSYGEVPEMRTIDGHEILFLDAYYSIDDYDGLIRFLDAIPAMDRSGDQDEYCWLRDPRAEDRSIKARLEIIGDELLVESNCRESMEDVKQLFASLDCVRLRIVKERELSPDSADDRLPNLTPQEPLDPAMFDALQEFVQSKMMEWIDESVPAFEGMTPREAARLPKFKEEVIAMINTMPDAGAPGGKKIPLNRQAILDELALGNEATES